mgnify:CR=1 FL=1
MGGGVHPEDAELAICSADAAAQVQCPTLFLSGENDVMTPAIATTRRNKAGRTFTQILPPTDGGVSAHSWSAHFVEVRVDELDGAGGLVAGRPGFGDGGPQFARGNRAEVVAPNLPCGVDDEQQGHVG